MNRPLQITRYKRKMSLKSRNKQGKGNLGENNDYKLRENFKHTYIINILRKETHHITPLKKEHNAIC